MKIEMVKISPHPKHYEVKTSPLAPIAMLVWDGELFARIKLDPGEVFVREEAHRLMKAAFVLQQ